MAGLAAFTIKPGSSGRLTGGENKEQIVKDAIRRAKEAVIFYRGLKDFARDPACEDTIDKIIKEENRHIRQITEQLEKK
jgi:rubrerythrin